MTKREKILRRIMLFWTAFIGLGALLGSSFMLLRPDGSLLGMQGILPFFQVLPFHEALFQNFIFPGISLLLVNGVTNLTAFFLIWKQKMAGAVLGAVFGFTLMLWIVIQFIIFPANFMSTLYFIFGLLQLLCGIFYAVVYKQSRFVFDASAYQKAGENKDILVVYFSREGYTKKIAWDMAEQTGACLLELQTAEQTAGYKGFAWCGRFGMHRWGMPLLPLPEGISAYKKVILVTPVWVFSISAPMREFCRQMAGKLQQTECVLVHFMKVCHFAAVFDEIDSLLGIRAAKRTSICCRFGKLVCRQVLLPAGETALPTTKEKQAAELKK